MGLMSLKMGCHAQCFSMSLRWSSVRSSGSALSASSRPSSTAPNSDLSFLPLSSFMDSPCIMAWSRMAPSALLSPPGSSPATRPSSALSDFSVLPPTSRSSLLWPLASRLLLAATPFLIIDFFLPPLLSFTTVDARFAAPPARAMELRAFLSVPSAGSLLELSMTPPPPRGCRRAPLPGRAQSSRAALPLFTVSATAKLPCSVDIYLRLQHTTLYLVRHRRPRVVLLASEGPTRNIRAAAGHAPTQGETPPPARAQGK